MYDTESYFSMKLSPQYANSGVAHLFENMAVHAKGKIRPISDQPVFTDPDDELLFMSYL
jgi:hypothetical protein